MKAVGTRSSATGAFGSAVLPVDMAGAWPPASPSPSFLVALLLAALMVSAGGCSGKTAKKRVAAPAASTEAADADAAGSWADLVDADTALAVDDGKVEVCSPTGWTRAAQSKGHLVKYVPSRRKTFPSIVVLATDAPEGVAEIDAGTQKEFVAAIGKSLAATYTKDGKSTLVKKPAAVRLGPHFGATWAAPATVSVDGVKESIDRVSYALVLGGRMYTVEVRAPKGKLDDEGRSAAKAVAATIALAPSAEPAAAQEPAAPSGQQEPAAPEPAAQEERTGSTG